MQDILNWPGDWVAGHLGEPGLAVPSNTQGVFSSSYSGPKGQKGAIGQINNNGVTGLVDENGHIRTINGPLPATIPGKRTSTGRKLAEFGGHGFERGFEGGRGFDGDGSAAAAAAAAAASGGGFFGRKLADFGGRGFERGFEGGRGFGGRGFDGDGSAAAAAAAAAASGGGFIGRKLTDFGGFDGGRGFQRGFDGRGFEGGRDFFNRGFDGGRDFFNRGFDGGRGFGGNWWGCKLAEFGGRGFERGFDGGFEGDGSAAAAAAAAAASGGGFFGRKLADSSDGRRG
ncbi:g5915 [Coccomyxa elongata]